MAASFPASSCPPRRWRGIDGAWNAHSIGTCWSSSIPSSRARGSSASRRSASASPVMKKVLAGTSEGYAPLPSRPSRKDDSMPRDPWVRFETAGGLIGHERGTGERTVVVLHGGPGLTDYVAPLADEILAADQEGL